MRSDWFGNLNKSHYWIGYTNVKPSAIKRASFWVVGSFLELRLHCSAMHGQSSGSSEGSSWCHRPNVHPVGFPGVLHWPGLDPGPVGWEPGSEQGLGGMILESVSFHRRGIQLMFAETALCCEFKCIKWSLMCFVPKALCLDLNWNGKGAFGAPQCSRTSVALHVWIFQHLSWFKRHLCSEWTLKLPMFIL